MQRNDLRSPATPGMVVMAGLGMVQLYRPSLWPDKSKFPHVSRESWGNPLQIESFPVPGIARFDYPGEVSLNAMLLEFSLTANLSTNLLLQIRQRFGYGSIPINTIFSGMNIHLPAILIFTRGTRFWHTAIWVFPLFIIPTTVPKVRMGCWVPCTSWVPIQLRALWAIKLPKESPEILHRTMDHHGSSLPWLLHQELVVYLDVYPNMIILFPVS